MATVDFFTLPVATTTNPGLESAADKTKLDAVPTPATIVTTTTAPELIQDTIGAALVAGSGVTVTYDDAAGTITITSTVTMDTETVQDIVGGLVVAGTGPISVTYNDAGNTLTISSSALTQATADTLYAALTHTSANVSDFTEAAQDAAANLFTSGTHTGITFTYDDATNKINATVTVSGGGSGMTNPMTAAGDTIVGAVAVLVNQATTANGASITATATPYGGNSLSSIIDNNDGTTCNFQTSAAGSRVIIDLGSQKAITAIRVMHNSASKTPSAFRVRSSTDNVTFTDRVTVITTTADTGDTALGTTVSARYWDFIIDTGNVDWIMNTFAIYTGTPPGTAARQNKGASRDFDWTANGDRCYVAPAARTVYLNVETGTGTLSYSKAAAGATGASPFTAQTAPTTSAGISMAAGETLKITCSGFSGFKAVSLLII